MSEAVKTKVSGEELLRQQDEIKAIIERASEGDGVVPDLLHKALDAVQGQLTEKVNAVAWVAHNADQEARGHKATADIFKAKAEVAARRRDRCKAYAQYLLAGAGLERVQGEHWSVRIQKNSTPHLVEEGKWPGDFTHTETIQDRGKLVDALKGGLHIDGFGLHYGQHVRIW